MAHTAPEDAQRPRAVYAINPDFRGNPSFRGIQIFLRNGVFNFAEKSG